MGSDTPERMDHERGENVFSVSISGAKGDDAELRGYWKKLSMGATVTQELEPRSGARTSACSSTRSA